MFVGAPARALILGSAYNFAEAVKYNVIDVLSSNVDTPTDDYRNKYEVLNPIILQYKSHYKRHKAYEKGKETEDHVPRGKQKY